MSFRRWGIGVRRWWAQCFLGSRNIRVQTCDNRGVDRRSQSAGLLAVKHFDLFHVGVSHELHDERGLERDTANRDKTFDEYSVVDQMVNSGFRAERR